MKMKSVKDFLTDRLDDQGLGSRIAYATEK